MAIPEEPEYVSEQKNKRFTARAPLIVEKLPVGDGQKSFFGYAKNLSRGGMFIATVKPREPGEEFTIELTLPTSPRCTIRCRCEVVWKRLFQKKSLHEPGMGLRFVEIADADADRIDAWVTEQTAQLAE